MPRRPCRSGGGWLASWSSGRKEDGRKEAETNLDPFDVSLAFLSTHRVGLPSLGRQKERREEGAGQEREEGRDSRERLEVRGDRGRRMDGGQEGVTEGQSGWKGADWEGEMTMSPWSGHLVRRERWQQQQSWDESVSCWEGVSMHRCTEAVLDPDLGRRRSAGAGRAQGLPPSSGTDQGGGRNKDGLRREKLWDQRQNAQGKARRRKECEKASSGWQWNGRGNANGRGKLDW